MAGLLPDKHQIDHLLSSLFLFVTKVIHIKMLLKTFKPKKNMGLNLLNNKQISKMTVRTWCWINLNKFRFTLLTSFYSWGRHRCAVFDSCWTAGSGCWSCCCCNCYNYSCCTDFWHSPCNLHHYLKVNVVGNGNISHCIPQSRVTQ